MPSSGRLIAATLLGPDHTFWPEVRTAADEWVDEHIIIHDEVGDAWGNETPWRKDLWHLAVERAKGGWIIILDSDFILTGDPRELTLSEAPSWSFELFDMWSRTHYRDDPPYWRAHRFPRAWMFNAAYAPALPEWGGRGIHAGHSPSNFPRLGSIAPSSHAILHLGWSTPEARQDRYDRYMSVKDQLGPWELTHVQTILDLNPKLVELPASLRFSAALL